MNVQGLFITNLRYYFSSMKIDELFRMHDEAPVDENGCKIWPLSLNNGYAQANIEGRMERVTRLILSRKLGRPVMRELVAAHSCDNPKCFHDRHLSEITQSQNIADAVERGRMIKGERAPQAKLSEEIVRFIREYKKDNPSVPNAILAEVFNISKQSVGQILSRKTWRHI